MSTVDPPRRSLDHREATYYEIPRRRRPVLGVLAWSIAGLLALAGSGVLFAHKYASYALDSELNNQPEVIEARKSLADAPKNLGDRPWNILLIGSDRRAGKQGRNDGGRGDTLILVRLDIKRNFISMLSFPRDLLVPIPAYGENKINAAYALGDNKLAIETIRQLTGEKIDHFFNVNFEAFRRLVNDADGVYLDIDRWYFNDNKGRGATSSFEQLDIKPGYQRLSGSDALDYVRYRHGDNDFGRIARQQAFLAELKRETRGARGLDNIVDAVHDEVQTSLTSTTRLKDFLLFGLRTEKDHVARITVPTTGQLSTSCCGSVVTTRPDLIAKAVDEWKNPVFQSDDIVKATVPSKVVVTVYNGSKKLGVGTKAAKELEAKGYQVTFSGDAPDGFYQNTSVFYADGKRNEAKAIQSLFGQGASIGERRAGQTTDADVIVFVGGDYENLVTPKPAPPPAKAKPDTVFTSSLRQTVKNARSLTGMDLLVPSHLPAGSSVRYVRVYNVERGDRGTRDAMTMVVQLPGFSKLGGNRYMTITQTKMKDPPIVSTGTGTDKQGNTTFYNGKNMQRLLWQQGEMTYWISNALDESLSPTTIRDIKAFMVRPGKVKPKKGQRDSAIPVSTTSKTP
jgi:LCP family protein required for cell wall assembly